MASGVAEEYQNFWNDEKEGASGYRLAAVQELGADWFS